MPAKMPPQDLAGRFAFLTRFPDGSQKEDEKIHQLRVLGKKLRAYFKLFQPRLGKKEGGEWNKRIAEATRPLALSRAALVLEKLQRKLRLEKSALRLPQPPRPDIRLLQTVKRELTAAKTLLEEKALPASQEGHLDQALKKTRKRLLKAGKKSAHLHCGSPLHDWRKLAKRLYYQLELAAPSTPSKELAPLKKLEDQLGKVHDLDDLASALRLKKKPKKISRRQKEHARKARQAFKKWRKAA